MAKLDESEDVYEDEFENVASPKAEEIDKIKRLAENYAIDASKEEDGMNNESDEDEDNYEEDDFEMSGKKEQSMGNKRSSNMDQSSGT